MADKYDLFKRNGIISKDGKVAAVLAPPLRPEPLQAELAPMIAEAKRRHVQLGLGVRQTDDEEVLVFVIDLGGPRDTHDFLGRLEKILTRHGVRPLDDDLDMDTVLSLANDLIAARQT